MRKNFLKKTSAAVIAALMAASMMTGCKSGDNNDNENTEDTGTSSITGLTIDLNDDDHDHDHEDEIIITSRPLEDGDDYAINKINNKSPEDSLPGGYTLMEVSEENQGKFYLADKSQIIINAYNYKEDLVDMPAWAENACVSMKMTSIMMYARDIDFKTPENVTVCGFDGIRYDTEITQYTNFDENGNKLEEGALHMRGRNYFFYSEQDAYVILFECFEEDWDSQLPLFEEFVKDLEVTKTEY